MKCHENIHQIDKISIHAYVILRNASAILYDIAKRAENMLEQLRAIKAITVKKYNLDLNDYLGNEVRKALTAHTFVRVNVYACCICILEVLIHA